MPEPTEADRARAREIAGECRCGPAGRCDACRLLYEPIRAALAQARLDRDMEWWQALCLVDVVAPEPAAVKAFVATMDEHGQEMARKEVLGELHDALAAAHAAIDPESHPDLSARLSRLLDCDVSGACREYQDSMALAHDLGRDLGRREERRACHDLFHADSPVGRGARHAIAARGPMEPPE